MGATFFAFNAPGKPVATANLVGTVLGLAAGAWWGATHPDDPVAKAARAGASALGLDPRLIPMATVTPVTDPRGRPVQGFGAQLAWAL